MPVTHITVDTPIEDCGLECPYFKIIESQFMSEGQKIWGTYSCENYCSCEEVLYRAGVLKDADDDEEDNQ